ncbi:MAG: ASCH domain-containing protein [Planctomycetaceae bacterium]
MDASEVKCLSVQQPYADWIVAGFKRVENRSWSTDYRGPILIHASAKQIVLDEQTIWDAEELGQTEEQLDALPLGAIVGVVELAGVISQVREDGRIRGPGEFTKELKKCVEACGEKLSHELLDQQSEIHYDYNSTYWWALARPRRLTRPIPCKGALRFWTPPPEVLDQLDLSILDERS